MNKKKFRALMAENGDTYKTLSEKIGMSESGLCNKVNERKDCGFTQLEIMTIKNLYHLTAEQIDDIFFDS